MFKSKRQLKCSKMERKSVKIFLVSCLVISSYQFRAHRRIIESNNTEGADSTDKTEFNPIFRPNVKVFFFGIFCVKQKIILTVHSDIFYLCI